MNDINNIKIRSPKVQNILGEIPKSLVFFGYVTILIILIGLVLTAILIPYPQGNGESILVHVFNKI